MAVKSAVEYVISVLVGQRMTLVYRSRFQTMRPDHLHAVSKIPCFPVQMRLQSITSIIYHIEIGARYAFFA